jgi:hypothetical protein
MLQMRRPDRADAFADQARRDLVRFLLSMLQSHGGQPRTSTRGVG